jgi:hypothetical protein
LPQDSLLRQLTSTAAAAIAAAVAPPIGTVTGDDVEAEGDETAVLLMAPVFVIEPTDGNSTSDADGSELDSSSPSQQLRRTPLDEYNARPNQGHRPPIPGSTAWPAYAQSHRLAVRFVSRTLPALASGGVGAETSDDVHLSQASLLDLLAPDCRYCLGASPAREESATPAATRVLLATPARVARLYGSLAAWRRRFAGSDWTATEIELLDWDNKQEGCRVRVRYQSTLRVALPAPLLSVQAYTDSIVDVRVTGTDVYELNSHGKIGKVVVEQTQVNGGSPQEGQAFVRSLCTAIDAGHVGGVAAVLGEDGWPGWLMRFASGGRAPGSAEAASDLAGLLPKLPDSALGLEGSAAGAFSDEASTTAFRVMEALIREVPLVIAPARKLSPPMPLPAREHLTESVRVLGYLNETILAGRSAYETSWSVALSAFTAALRSGSVQVEPPESPSDTVRVELTASKSIRLTANLQLKVKPIPGAILPALSSSLTSSSSDSFAVPVRIGVVSDYILDPSTGRIAVHKLVETRVNGQLAPGDVVARWVRDWSTQPIAAVKPSGSDGGGDSLWRALFESAVSNLIRSRPPT